MDIKEKIVISSSKLLVDFGVKGVTMDDVAANLGMSKRTLYEHFKDKKELILACVEHMIAEQENNLNCIHSSAENVIYELFAMFGSVDEEFNKRNKLSFDIKKYYPDIYATIYAKHYDHSYDKMKTWLSRGIDQELILPDVDLDLTVYVMTETMNNLASRPERINTTKLSLMDAFKYVIIYFFRGVATNKGVELIDTLIKKEKMN